MKPIVSIIITTFNYAKFLSECIDSCINQNNFENYEIIIVNDGSTDESREIISRYLTMDKVKYFEIENSGIEKASNFGILHSNGKYIVRVDADDCLCGDYLVNSLKAFEKEECGFVYSNYSLIDEQSRCINEVELPMFSVDEIKRRGDFLATGTMYNREILSEISLYNEEIKNCGLENYELVLKLINNGVVGFHISNSLFCYRRHGHNISALKKEAIINYANRYLLVYLDGKYSINQYHPYLKMENL